MKTALSIAENHSDSSAFIVDQNDENVKDADSTLGIYTGNSSTAQSRHARGAQTKYYLQKLSAELLPKERVASCMQIIIPGRKGVDVLYSTELERAAYGNLCACTSLWICPVCASRISEQRALLLGEGIRRAKVTPMLLTFTMRHADGQPLAVNLAALKGAYHNLTSGRWFDAFRERFWWLASISALEVTHGQSGWHPHLHVLGLFKHKFDAEFQVNFECQLADQWVLQLQKQGADADREHGLDVKATFGEVADYVSKFGRQPVVKDWSAAREMTKAVVKQARTHGRTPWALLADYGNGDQNAGILFKEYSAAFKGSKQLNISARAKKLLDLANVISDDKAMAAQALSKFELLLMTLTVDQWRRVLYSDQRQPLLEHAATGNADALRDWLLEVGILP